MNECIAPNEATIIAVVAVASAAWFIVGILIGYRQGHNDGHEIGYLYCWRKNNKRVRS